MTQRAYNVKKAKLSVGRVRKKDVLINSMGRRIFNRHRIIARTQRCCSVKEKKK
jgi:hypothetical protein